MTKMFPGIILSLFTDFNEYRAGCPELSIVHARAQAVDKKLLETMRLTGTHLLLVVQTLQKKVL